MTAGKNFRREIARPDEGEGWYYAKLSWYDYIQPVYIYAYKNGKWRGVHWGRGIHASHIKLYGKIDDCEALP